MTYGEAHIAELNSIILENGTFRKTLKLKIPDRMNKYEAGRYYNKKFFNYWLEFFEGAKRKEKLSYLVFRDKDKYKDII